jgi:hypothetical protein
MFERFKWEENLRKTTRLGVWDTAIVSLGTESMRITASSFGIRES